MLKNPCSVLTKFPVSTPSFCLLCGILYAGDWRLAMLTAIGVGLAVVFNPLTSYFTSTKKPPVKEIVDSTENWSSHHNPFWFIGRNGIKRMGAWWSFFSFIFAVLLYQGDGDTYILYAVAMIGIGMLSHTGNNVAMDSYGPISDNANGIGEMAWHDME